MLRFGVLRRLVRIAYMDEAEGAFEISNQADRMLGC